MSTELEALMAPHCRRVFNLPELTSSFSGGLWTDPAFGRISIVEAGDLGKSDWFYIEVATAGTATCSSLKKPVRRDAVRMCLEFLLDQEQWPAEALVWVPAQLTFSLNEDGGLASTKQWKGSK